MSKESPIDLWRINGCRYESGDTVTLGNIQSRILFNQPYVYSELTEREWQIIHSLGKGPWEVYSTNKYPKRRRCKVVRYLHIAFVREFGSIAGVMNIHGGGGWGCFNSKSNQEWRPPKDSITQKNYIKYNSDGYFVITNPKQFVMDLLKFKNEMKSKFAELHYSWNELDRLDWYVLPPDRILKEEVEFRRIQKVR